MNNICRNCPIESVDSNAPALSAVAGIMSETGKVDGDAWIKSAKKRLGRYDENEVAIAERALEARVLSEEHLHRARICAQQILWRECEFHGLE